MTKELSVNTPRREDIFRFSRLPIPALGPIQPPIQWVTRDCFLRCVMVRVWSWPLNLVQRLGMCGATSPLPHIPSTMFLLYFWIQVTRINCYADLLGLMLLWATDSSIKHPVTSGKNYGMCTIYIHCKFQNLLKQKVVERNLIFLGQLAVTVT